MEYLNLNRASRLLADLTGNPSATDDVQAIIEAGAQGEIPIYWRNAAQVWTRLSDFKGDLKGTDSAARHLQLEPHTVAKLETDTNATVLSFALTGQDVDTLTKLFGDIIDVDGNLLGYRHTIGDEVVTITRDQLRVRTDDLKAYAATLSPDEVVVAPAHAPATVNQVKKAVPISKVQDDAIIAELKSQGYDPLELPKNPPGKPGIPAKLKKSLLGIYPFTTISIFDHALERLAKNGDIQYKK